MAITSASLTDISVAPGSLSISVPFSSNRSDKTVAFTGGVGLGQVGTVALYTVTGSVFVYLMSVCTENLTEAAPTATVEVGYAGATAVLIAQTDAVDIDNGMVWLGNTPAVRETLASIGGLFVADGADIILTVAAQNVPDGTLTFYCFWTPLAPGSSVIAA